MFDDPVRLPFPAVERERLLPARGIGTQARPTEDDLDRPTFVGVVALRENVLEGSWRRAGDFTPGRNC